MILDVMSTQTRQLGGAYHNTFVVRLDLPHEDAHHLLILVSVWQQQHKHPLVTTAAGHAHVNSHTLTGSVVHWLRRWTCDSVVASSIPGCCGQYRDG